VWVADRENDNGELRVHRTIFRMPIAGEEKDKSAGGAESKAEDKVWPHAPRDVSLRDSRAVGMCSWEQAAFAKRSEAAGRAAVAASPAG
jgi:hypothetical protein